MLSAAIASLYIILSSAATSNSQEIVQCYDASVSCMLSFTIVPLEDCCNNSILPLGGSFVQDGVEGCQLCDVVFGFTQTTLVGPERPGVYTIGFGFLSGFPMNFVTVNFTLNTDTASDRDVTLFAPPLVFPLEQRILTSISFLFVTDGVALESDETFTITFTGLRPADLEFGATIIPQFTGTIVNVDRLGIFFTEDDYAETEGVGTAIHVMVRKNRPIANPLTLAVTPVQIGTPPLLGLTPIPPSNPLSPNRADENDFEMAAVILTFLPDEFDLTQQLPAPIEIFNDDIDENREQLFAVTLSVLDAANLDLVDNSINNVSLCRIKDDDPLRIGFEFALYEFTEPTSLTAFTDSVFLVKEENMVSERTFNVTITVREPPGAPPATLQSTDPTADFDYSIGGAGVSTTSILFPPEASRLAFSFELNGDDLTEGSEAFLAVSSSTPGFPLFQIPLFIFSDTVIRIMDDDMAVVGFLEQFVNVSESDGQALLEIGVISGTLQRDLVLQLLLIPGTAQVGTDFLDPTAGGGTMITLTSAGSVQVTFALVDDDITEDSESLQAMLSFADEFHPNVTLSPSVATVTIFDNDNGGMVNDSTIGDPFFTVPIYVPAKQLETLETDSLALCYELHGEPDKWFNLVTDKCATVNGHFVLLSESLNVIDEIGVRTVDDSSRCVDIRVNVHQCTAEVNGASLNLAERYFKNGVSVRRKANRVRISVPNCNDITLVMWAICEIDLPGQPGEMIKFVVTRGLNFGVRAAHGLFGQFWNAPASILPFDGRFKDGTPVSNRYLVNITTPAGRSRGLVGFIYPNNWQGDQQTCMYVGDRQGGPNFNIAVYNGGVVEGSYKDYQVPGPYAEGDYKFGLFDEEKC